MVSADGRFEKSPTAEKTVEPAPSAVSAGGGSGEVHTGQCNIYQPPASLQGWLDDNDTEAALRYLGLLDFARLQLPDGIPRRPRFGSRRLLPPGELPWLCLPLGRPRQCRPQVLPQRGSPPSHGGAQGAPSTAQDEERKELIRGYLCRLEVHGNVDPPAVPGQGHVAVKCIVCDAGGEGGVSAYRRLGELIWDLVQNEILELPKRDDKNSYFGLHLLRLIWVKHPEVFGLKDRMERLARVHLDRILPQVVGNVTERIRLEFTRPKKITRFFQVQQPQVVNNLSKWVEFGDEAAAVVQVQQQSMVGDEAAAVVQQQSMVGDEAAAVVQVQQQYMVGDEAAAVVQVQQQSIVGDEAAAVVQVQQQSMVVQSSPLAIVLNNDASVGKRDSLVHKDGGKHVKQQFQQGNQQKQTRNTNKCSVPSGSIVLNDDASVGKRDSMEAGLVEPEQADAHKHEVKHVKQQFQQGNQQKWTRMRSKHRVPSGSTISSANISRDIIGIKSEVKRAQLENQPTKELLEAEMFIQAIAVLNKTLSVDTIVHSRTLRRLAPR